MALRAWNGLALCAGVGGLELGLKIALRGNYKVVGYVERDTYSASVLVERMADASLDRAPVWDDIGSLDGRDWRGRVDLCSSGFPCQPFSSAGRRKGTADERWLWPEVVRLIRQCEPYGVFLENVPGLAVHGLDCVLEGLAALGYDAEWDLFSAGARGAPHLRRRFFLVARRVSDPRSQELRVFPERGRGAARSAEPGDTGATSLGPTHLADSDRGGFEGGGLSERTRIEGEGGCELDRCDQDGDKLRPFPPGPADCEEWHEVLKRWPGLAPAEPEFLRLADGMAARMDRLRAAGEGVVPVQAAFAFRFLWHRGGWS